MSLKSNNFKIHEFNFPAFELKGAEMIRFWVQIVPRNEGGTDGYWGVEKMKEALSKLQHDNSLIKICPNRIKRSFLDFLTPKSVGEFLEKKHGLTSTEVQDLISNFEIKPEYKVKNLGTGHQKVLSIINEFQSNKIIAFDYYGLCPNTESQLTKYIKSELKKGKSAISFDNLYYQPEKLDSENIINIEIRRN